MHWIFEFKVSDVLKWCIDFETWPRLSVHQQDSKSLFIPENGFTLGRGRSGKCGRRVMFLIKVGHGKACMENLALSSYHTYSVSRKIKSPH